MTPPSKPSLSRTILTNGVLLLCGSWLLACPSEPKTTSEIETTGLRPNYRPASPIDQVDVKSPDEASFQASEAITPTNVLDELEALESEMGEP